VTSSPAGGGGSGDRLELTGGGGVRRPRMLLMEKSVDAVLPPGADLVGSDAFTGSCISAAGGIASAAETAAAGDRDADRSTSTDDGEAGGEPVNFRVVAAVVDDSSTASRQTVDCIFFSPTRRSSSDKAVNEFLRYDQLSDDPPIWVIVKHDFQYACQEVGCEERLRNDLLFLSSWT